MKIVINILIFYIILSSLILLTCCHDEKEDTEFSIKFKKLYNDFNFNEKNIPKQNFKEFFIKLLLKDSNDLRKAKFLRSIFEHYIIDLPEFVELEKMADYIDYPKFLISIRAAIKDQFGEEYVEQVMEQINKESEFENKFNLIKQLQKENLLKYKAEQEENLEKMRSENKLEKEEEKVEL